MWPPDGPDCIGPVVIKLYNYELTACYLTSPDSTEVITQEEAYVA